MNLEILYIHFLLQVLPPTTSLSIVSGLWIGLYIKKAFSVRLYPSKHVHSLVEELLLLKCGGCLSSTDFIKHQVNPYLKDQRLVMRYLRLKQMSAYASWVIKQLYDLCHHGQTHENFVPRGIRTNSYITLIVEHSGRFN